MLGKENLERAEPAPTRLRADPPLVAYILNGSFLDQQPLTIVDSQLNLNAFPLDLFNRWEAVWLNNCSRPPGNGLAIDALATEAQALHLLNNIDKWTSICDVPIISIAAIGQIDRVDLPKAIIIGTEFHGGTAFCIPINVFGSYNVRKAMFGVFSNEKIIKAMFGTCALLELVHGWAYNCADDDIDYIEWKGARSVLDIEQLFNGPAKVGWDSTNTTCCISRNDGSSYSFRRSIGLPECHTLNDVFSAMFKQVNLRHQPLFSPHTWSKIDQWSSMTENVHKQPLLAYAMQQIDLVFLFAMCSDMKVFKPLEKKLLTLVRNSIQDNWLFPKSILRSAYFEDELVASDLGPMVCDAGSCAWHTPKSESENPKSCNEAPPGISEDESNQAGPTLLRADEVPMEVELTTSEVREDGIPADQLMSHDEPMPMAVESKKISRRFFALLKEYDEESHAYLTCIPKCLYLRSNYAYGRYRFVCAKFRQLLHAHRRTSYMPAARILLRRFIIGKAPGRFWFDFWRSRVPTRNQMLSTKRDAPLKQMRSSLHSKLWAKFGAHKTNRLNRSNLAPTKSFFRAVSRQANHFRGYWLRALAAQRRNMTSLTKERLTNQTWRRRRVRVACRPIKQRHVQPKTTTAAMDCEPSVSASNLTNNLQQPETHEFRRMLESRVARDSRFLRWREQNNIQLDNVNDSDSWDIKIQAFEKLDREYGQWRAIHREAMAKPQPPPCSKPPATSTSRVNEWLESTVTPNVQQERLIRSIRELLITEKGIGPGSAEAIATEHILGGCSGFEDIIKQLKRRRYHNR